MYYYQNQNMSQSSSVSFNMTGGPHDFDVYEDIELSCQQPSCDCKWTFTAGEQQWYDNMGFTYPRKCAACKALKKKVKPTTYHDITLTCKDCKHDFQWLARDQAFFAKQNTPFPKPVRCRSCKQDRNQRFRN